MGLFRIPVIAEIYHDSGKSEVKQFKSFRHAKRAILEAMFDKNSNVYGASFSLMDGKFLKEIRL